MIRTNIKEMTMFINKALKLMKSNKFITSKQNSRLDTKYQKYSLETNFIKIYSNILSKEFLHCKDTYIVKEQVNMSKHGISSNN